jgi:hypothetical protein
MPPVTPGTSPGKPFVTGDGNATDGLKIGVITRVDEHTLRADVKVITGGEEQLEIELTQAMCGPRSFLGGIPEVNSRVILGYRRRHKQLYEAMILGYLPSGHISALRFDPFAGVDPSEIDPADQNYVDELYGKPLRYKRIKGKPGDILGMSTEGAELALTRDVKFYNRAGDLFELRDADRTLVTQAIHRVHSDAAVYHFSGGARRGAMDLPSFVFVKGPDGAPTRQVKGEDVRYFGRDANGRSAHYPTDQLATNFEGEDGSGRVFTEDRFELRHDTDLRQPVLEEIDGFTPEPQPVFVERVFGTVIGNDPYGTQGQRQYGRVLKPQLFDDFDARNTPGFSLEEALRAPGGPDEALSMAAAVLLRLRPPGTEKDAAFAVSKQGKLFVNLPGSRVENYAQKNISAEINCEGAVKARIGASTPDRISLHLVMDGGVTIEYGADAEGNSITSTYRGAVKNVYAGGNNTDDVAHSHAVQGNSETSVSGNAVESVQGARDVKVQGAYSLVASDVAVRSLNGYSLSAQSLNTVVAGKSQATHAQLVQETIATGGRISIILAGSDVKTILAGAMTTTVAAGATTFNNPAGAFAVNVGAGALSLTTAAGALSLTAGVGAVSVTSGAMISLTAALALNLTAPITSILSAQILFGGPAAVLGVARGAPMLPPGAPSLDWITGLPLQGSAVVRSF